MWYDSHEWTSVDFTREGKFGYAWEELNSELKKETSMGAYLNDCWDNSAEVTLLFETSMNNICKSCSLDSTKDQIQLSWLRPSGCSLYLRVIMQLWAASWLIASIFFRLSKHRSHTDAHQTWTLFYLKPGKFGTDRPYGQNDEYLAFAIHPQAVLNCLWLSGQPALLGHAQRQPRSFCHADNKTPPILDRRRLLWCGLHQPKGCFADLPTCVLALAKCVSH